MPKKSRHETLSRMGAEINMPPVSYGANLAHYLWQFGPVCKDGAPIQWGEIQSWATMTRRTLSAWEAETLREMSEQYAIWHIKGRNPACDAPWKHIKIESSKLSESILDMFAPVVRKSTGE